MSAAIEIHSFEALGWAFRLDAGKVKATPPSGASDADISALRANRDALKAQLIARAANALPCPSDILHDAAVIEEGNGCTSVEAMAGAAQSYGFDNLDAAAVAIVSGWRHSITATEPTTDAAQQAKSDALAMLDSHGGDLVGQGWGAVDLFGLHQSGNRHGLAFKLKGGAVAWVSDSEINYRAGAVGRVSIFNRMTVAPSAVAFWELPQ